MTESIALDLTFSFGLRLDADFDEELGRLVQETGLPERSQIRKPRASLGDCQQLLLEVSEWIGPALEFRPKESVEVLGIDMALYLLGDSGPALRPHQDPVRVKELHSGSPFEMQFLLPVLTPAGLAGVFYAAKRLYGIDLEFKAYREDRRAEYKEAKARADHVAEQKSQTSMIRRKAFWRMLRGELRDSDSG